jgi:uncharacterized membrane protein
LAAAAGALTPDGATLRSRCRSMAVTLHALSARHLSGGLLIAAATSASLAWLARHRLPFEALIAVAWDAGVLVLGALMLCATLRYDERQMPKKVRHRAPSAGLLVMLAIGAAGFGIYSIFLLLTVGQHRLGQNALLFGAVGAATTALSWGLVHLLFALEYARVYYAPVDSDGASTGGLDFPGGHQPNYIDFLYFSFVIGVACQTAEVATLTRAMRKIVLAQGLIAFVFNTVILAATINVAAGLIQPG